MSAHGQRPDGADDALAARIRSLEAERLRPVPPPPALIRHADLNAISAGRRPRRKAEAPDPGIAALRRAGELYRAKNQHQDDDGGSL